MTTAQKIRDISRRAEIANETDDFDFLQLELETNNLASQIEGIELELADPIELETAEFNEWFDTIRTASNYQHAAGLMLAADCADLPARYRF